MYPASSPYSIFLDNFGKKNGSLFLFFFPSSSIERSVLAGYWLLIPLNSPLSCTWNVPQGFRAGKWKMRQLWLDCLISRSRHGKREFVQLRYKTIFWHLRRFFDTVARVVFILNTHCPSLCSLCILKDIVDLEGLDEVEWQLTKTLTDNRHLPWVLLTTDRGPDCPLFSTKPVFKAILALFHSFRQTMWWNVRFSFVGNLSSKTLKCHISLIILL